MLTYKSIRKRGSSDFLMNQKILQHHQKFNIVFDKSWFLFLYVLVQGHFPTVPICIFHRDLRYYICICQSLKSKYVWNIPNRDMGNLCSTLAHSKFSFNFRTWQKYLECKQVNSHTLCANTSNCLQRYYCKQPPSFTE